MNNKLKTAFCFDLDGTITKEEILPLISKNINLFDEMQALTLATINGLIPFESSFKLRTMILNSIPIPVVQDLVYNVKLHESILAFMNSNRENCFIITGNLDVWLEKLTMRLGIKTYSSIADYEDNKLKGIKNILNKGDAIEKVRDLGFERIISIGDGMGDVAMFEKSDICIAFGGVHKPVESLIELSNFIVFNENSLCRTLNTLL